ncbi:gp53-like domain-containing protein [Enterobacter asburiae]|uniref:gp53-like domain-containing protein n=1 Tax=Enterobacter asburiae TaxID=61645 RepID=UPI0005F94058|nr:hypothetical protein [Enterobacter asburiae]KJW82019.1 hypothetical protein SG67_15850 [Enterobacter asburiae]KJX09251.1 hypothetical protein SG66_17990 [Enterobacter asburiae]
MHRIDTSTAQKDKFGAGKNGFTRGNPQTGTPATDLDDDYFDMLQEELAGVVEATGIVLDKTKHNQLLTALKALFLSRQHPFADIKADGAAAISTALTNLGLKEAAKREVGTGLGQIPDMSAFTSGPGWVRFPDGTTIQQGSAGFATGVNNQYVTLPRAFSSANFRVATVWNDVGVPQGGATAQAAADIGLGAGTKTTTRFGLWQGGSGGFNVDWIAIGVS